MVDGFHWCNADRKQPQPVLVGNCSAQSLLNALNGMHGWKPMHMAVPCMQNRSGTTLRLSHYVPVVFGLDLHRSHLLYKQMWSMSHPSHQLEFRVARWCHFHPNWNHRIFMSAHAQEGLHPDVHAGTHICMSDTKNLFNANANHISGICVHASHDAPTWKGEHAHKVMLYATCHVSIICSPGELSVTRVEH